MDTLRSIWNQMPAVRLLLPFMAGIGICIGVDFVPVVFAVILFLSIALIIFVNLQKSVSSVYKWRYVSGVAVSLAMLSLGYVVTFFNTERLDPHHIAETKGTAIYAGIITDPVVIRDKTVSALIELKKVKQGDLSHNINGKVLASIVKDDKSSALKYGDEIIFEGQVKDYEGPKNPEQFNYKIYQSLHHIYQHTYLRADEWKVAGGGEGNPILTKIYQARTYLLSLIKREVVGANELAVATAIMLGYRDYITDDVTQAYAGSGVLHVLSVSGLHVAVLYFVLNALLGWMDKRRKLQIIKGVLVIIIMLFYAGLTGLSPPVLRSVWMFTLITIAMLLDRDVSMYNVLGVSCLLLLLWDPYYIADVGFQLSYIAVAGIVYLHPLISGIISETDVVKTKFRWFNDPLNWGLRWTWGLVSVSIAAQIATFPISLFYFHTFPNFFLLSNLLVIPLSNFVLISGMLLFVVGWSESLVSVVGSVFDHLLIGLNKVVFGIDALPFSLSKGIMLTSFEMVVFYMVIGMVCWYIADRRAKVLIASLCFILVLCTAFSIDHIRKDGKREVVVYHVQGKKAIAIIDRGVAYYDFDSALIHDEILMRNNVRGHWYALDVKAQMPLDSMRQGYSLPFGKIYEIGGKRAMVIDGDLPTGNKVMLKADVLILSNGAKSSLSELSEALSFSQIIFDTSNKPWQIKKWKAECEAKNIPYHDCRDKAFVMEW